MKTEIIVILAVVQFAYGVIHRLNVSEYARMPQLFRLEGIDGCLQKPGDTYCYFDAKIADGDSELQTLIREYSANILTHFDHTLIHWGVCVTQTCRQYYGNTTLENALNTCINATLYESHGLQARVINETNACTVYGESTPYDLSDFVVAAVFLTILMLNVFGTLYDLCLHSGQRNFVSRFLLCFALRRNWQKLVLPSGDGPNPKLRSLKGLNGIKAMTTLLVLLGHSPLTGFIAVDNPQYQEEIYHNPLFQMLLNGTLVVQTFFVVSGFLLSFNILVTEEKRRSGWAALPQGIFLRWLRLTPAYAVVLAFVSTLVRHLSSGPLWKVTVDQEVLDCRRDWWLHMLYIDNYVDNSQCMPQAWYISGDMQLSILGLAIFSLCRGARARKIAVGVAFVAGLLTPATHTFFQNLHAVLIVSPEMARNFFVQDTTFNNLYKRGHTNLVCYAMGMALGMLMYDLHGKNPTKDKQRQRWVFWGSIPVGFGFVFLGMMFYINDIQIPLMVRVVYSSAIKMCFGAVICIIIGGTILRLDSVVRGIFEWHGWAPLGRVSYSAYLIHVCVLRTSTAFYTALQHTSLYHIILNYCGLIGVTYALSAACWLLVESPATQLIKLCFQGGDRHKSEKSDITVKAAPPKWQDQELSSSVETVVVKTSL